MYRHLIREKITAVIHFAGVKSVAESLHDPIKYYSYNVSGTISLLEAMKRSSVTALVFSSSATVYGNAVHLPVDEGHPIQTLNPYGRSKAHVEEILFDASTASNSWKIACLRYFNPVGAHESGLIGEIPIDVPSNLMPYLTGVAIGKYPYLSIFGNDYETRDGTAIRDFIHVLDLAEGHLSALDFLQKNGGFNVFNLGTGEGVTVLELVAAFEQANNLEIPVKFVGRRAGDVAISFANPSKARNILRWTHQRSLSDMCGTAWRHCLYHHKSPIKK